MTIEIEQVVTAFCDHCFKSITKRIRLGEKNEVYKVTPGEFDMLALPDGRHVCLEHITLEILKPKPVDEELNARLCIMCKFDRQSGLAYPCSVCLNEKKYHPHWEPK